MGPASGGGLPEELPLPELLPDDEPLPHGPQVPCVLPVATMQLVPVQQSALVVHAPAHAMHDVLEQISGGFPLGFGTHGLPLQQSALVAHALPAPPMPASGSQPLAQRGTPRLSGLHAVFLLPRPAQQSWFALHDVVMSLQTSPFGVQPMCCWQ